MTVREQVRPLRHEILQAAEANGARRIRLFGSVARDHETGASDVDLLLALEPAARCWTSPASKRGSSAC